MSTNAIAIRTEHGLEIQPSQVTEVQRLGGLLAASGYFSDAREMAQAAVKVMAGQELGIPPVAAMMGINIIKGKVALGGNLIASRIRAHGYEYRHKTFDNTGCTLVFFSKPGPDGKREVLGESSFTDADAKTAQISSDMYKKFPRNMFFNRAISNGARWYTPEVFAGAPVYTPEELGARVDEQGEVAHDEYAELKRDARAIDTGGHAIGTEAAAAHVAQQKIAAAQAKVTALPIPEEQQVPDEVRMMWAEMHNIKAVCDTFANLKARLVAVMGAGGEAEYYRLLKQYGGVDHANQLKQKAARQASWRMWDSIQQAESLRGDVVEGDGHGPEDMEAQ